MTGAAAYLFEGKRRCYCLGVFGGMCDVRDVGYGNGGQWAVWAAAEMTSGRMRGVWVGNGGMDLETCIIFACWEFRALAMASFWMVWWCVAGQGIEARQYMYKVQHPSSHQPPGDGLSAAVKRGRGRRSPVTNRELPLGRARVRVGLRS